MAARRDEAETQAEPSAEQLRAWAQGEGAQHVDALEDPCGQWVRIVRPPLEGADSWSHWFHEPDNNPVSRDAAIEPPFITQWFGKPYYVAMPMVTTAAAGRVFVATGHIAHHEREVPALNLLTARNGYNGQALWTRKLPDGYLVHRSAFIATADVFYMIDGAGVLKLDPETGEELGRVDLQGIEGGLNWIALRDGVLYVQGGDQPAPAVTTLVASNRDHWSWGELSAGYYQRPRVPWGFGVHLAACDAETGGMIWRHTEPTPIDSRGLGMSGSRLFFYAPDARMGCLDARTGQLLWAAEDGHVLQLIEAPGKGLVSTPGWRSTCIMLCTEEVLLSQGQTRQHVVAVSANDGSLLWTKQKQRNDPTLLVVDGEVITSHENGGTFALDPVTGDTVRDLGFRKVNCTRMTATPYSLFCRGEGLGHYARADGKYRVDGSARPGCNDGPVPANGLLYVGPWACDCNLSIIGTMALSPARGLDVAAAQEHSPRLQRGEAAPEDVEPLEVTGADWPTYRGTNSRSGSSRAAAPEAVRHAWRYVPERPAAMTAPVAAGGLVVLGREDGKVSQTTAAHGAHIGPFSKPATAFMNDVG